jgi:uncharacterized protein YjiS (DUF1127 family)
MPPQKTNFTSETGRNVAALLDACSEEGAAERPAASTRNVLSLLKRCWRAFQERCQRERLRVSLRDLSKRELMDIGLTSDGIEYIDAHRTIESLRDGTKYLWPSSGV